MVEYVLSAASPWTSTTYRPPSSSQLEYPLYPHQTLPISSLQHPNNSWSLLTKFYTQQSLTVQDSPAHTTTPTTILKTAIMSAPYTVQIHQSSKEPSIHSSYSYSSGSYVSSTDSTPRSLSPGEYREYGADKHTTQVAKSGRNTVINHHKVGFEQYSPSPTYSNSYSRS
ncbi:hypothetical protein FALCPG4_000470 [Fusarium falciforme]